LLLATQEYTFLNLVSDAAVVTGMILLNEANNLKGEMGKKRSE
jgi:hypothetical protein